MYTRSIFLARGRISVLAHEKGTKWFCARARAETIIIGKILCPGYTPAVLLHSTTATDVLQVIAGGRACALHHFLRARVRAAESAEMESKVRTHAHHIVRIGVTPQQSPLSWCARARTLT